MNRRPYTILMLAIGLLSFSELGQAQGLRLGPHAGFDFDRSDLYVGGNIVVPIGLEVAETAIDLNADASLWITSDGYNVFVIDGNLLYPFNLESENIAPYAGAGIALSFTSVDVPSGINCEIFNTDLCDNSSTNFQLNIKGGAEFGSSNMKPFGEVGLYFIDGSVFYLQGGVRFALGGS